MRARLFAALAATASLGVGLAWEIVNTWLATPFSKGDRHVRRIAKIDP